MSNELSVLRTPRTASEAQIERAFDNSLSARRTLSRCLPRSPCDSRLDSASTETRPPSSQARAKLRTNKTRTAHSLLGLRHAFCQVPLLPRPRRLEQEGQAGAGAKVVSSGRAFTSPGALGALEATVWPAGSARWRRLELVKTSPSPPSPGPGRPAQRNRDSRSSDAFLGPVDCEARGGKRGRASESS